MVMVYKGTRQDGPDSISCDRSLIEDGEVIVEDNVLGAIIRLFSQRSILAKGLGANSVVMHDIPSATIAVLSRGGSKNKVSG